MFVGVRVGVGYTVVRVRRARRGVQHVFRLMRDISEAENIAITWRPCILQA